MMLVLRWNRKETISFSIKGDEKTEEEN